MEKKKSSNLKRRTQKRRSLDSKSQMHFSRDNPDVAKYLINMAAALTEVLGNTKIKHSTLLELNIVDQVEGIRGGVKNRPVSVNEVFNYQHFELFSQNHLPF